MHLPRFSEYRTLAPPPRGGGANGLFAFLAGGAAFYFLPYLLPEPPSELRWGAAGGAGVFVLFWGASWLRKRAFKPFWLLLDVWFRGLRFRRFRGRRICPRPGGAVRRRRGVAGDGRDRRRKPRRRGSGLLGAEALAEACRPAPGARPLTGRRAQYRRGDVARIPGADQHADARAGEHRLQRERPAGSRRRFPAAGCARNRGRWCRARSSRRAHGAGWRARRARCRPHRASPRTGRRRAAGRRRQGRAGQRRHGEGGQRGGDIAGDQMAPHAQRRAQPPPQRRQHHEERRQRHHHPASASDQPCDTQ